MLAPGVRKEVTHLKCRELLSTWLSYNTIRAVMLSVLCYLRVKVRGMYSAHKWTWFLLQGPDWRVKWFNAVEFDLCIWMTALKIVKGVNEIIQFSLFIFQVYK